MIVFCMAVCFELLTSSSKAVGGELHGNQERNGCIEIHDNKYIKAGVSCT